MIKENDIGQFTLDMSLVQNLTFKQADQVFADKAIPFGEQQKRSLGLIRPDGRYSNLAHILSDQCPLKPEIPIFGTIKIGDIA